MSIQDSLERLSLGIQLLATHEGPIKERLVFAFQQDLYAVGPASLPDQARRIWESVWKEVTAVRDGANEGNFGLSIRVMSPERAARIAEQIWTVHSLTLWKALYLPDEVS